MRLDEAKPTRKQPDYADGNNDHYCSHRNQAACALLMPTRRRQRRVSRRRMVVRDNLRYIDFAGLTEVVSIVLLCTVVLAEHDPPIHSSSETRNEHAICNKSASVPLHFY